MRLEIKRFKKLRYVLPIIYVVAFIISVLVVNFLIDSGLGSSDHIIGNGIAIFCILITVPVFIIPFFLAFAWPIFDEMSVFEGYLFLLVPVSILFVAGYLLEKLKEKNRQT
jgi:hypothetical protein